MLDTIREMAVAVTRLEKRPTELETSAAASEPDQPPPSLPMQFPYIPSASLTVGGYEIPAPGMPMGVPLPEQTSNGQTEAVKLKQFTIGESLGSYGLE